MIDPIAKLLGEWSYTLNFYSVLFRVILIIIISFTVGCERSSNRHSAGIRTFIIVSLLSTVTILLDEFISLKTNNDFYLLSMATIIGLSMVSIRTLLITSKNQIKGLTTAVALVFCGILGLTCGIGFYTVTIIGYVMLHLLLSIFPYAEKYLKNRSNHFEIHLELKDKLSLENFVTTIRRLGLNIDDIEANHAYDGSGLSVYTISLSVYSNELKKYKTHKEIIEALRTLPYMSYIEEMSL